MFVLFLLKRGILSSLLNNKILAYGGKYSYSIYVMQQCSFILSGQIIKQIHCSDGVALALVMLNAILLGIVTYYLIEKPIGKLLDKFLKYYLCSKVSS